MNIPMGPEPFDTARRRSSKRAAPRDLAIARKLSGNIRSTGAVDAVPGANVEWRSRTHVEDRTELPALDQRREESARVCAKPFARTER